MAAKYTTVLAALLAVLSSSTRRKPEYIRQQALVSQLYPYFFEDALAAGSEFVGGRVFGVVDSGDVADITAAFGGGELRSVVINYNDWPIETLSIGAVLSSGELRSVVINYNDWPVENLSATATFAGGGFPSIFYGNYETEQLNIAATFAGGSLG
jgi:hypothetical protein